MAFGPWFENVQQDGYRPPTGTLPTIARQGLLGPNLPSPQSAPVSSAIVTGLNQENFLRMIDDKRRP